MSAPLTPVQRIQAIAMEAECAKKDCLGLAVAEPVIRVWDRPWARNDKAANFHLAGYGLCSTCIGAATADELLPAQQRQQIDAAWKKDGKTLPDWQTAKLTWVPIPAPAVELQVPA